VAVTGFKLAVVELVRADETDKHLVKLGSCWLISLLLLLLVLADVALVFDF
jgi:hypothetical protein